MILHYELEYKDIEKATKIVVREDMIKPIYQSFVLYKPKFVIKYDFETLNIELLFNQKLNIFIENENEKFAMITVFANEIKLVSFLIEYVNDAAFGIHYIFEYIQMESCNLTVEEIEAFVLEWYVKVVFYKQWHTIIEEQKCNNNSITFFVNTKNYKLEDKKKSR